MTNLFSSCCQKTCISWLPQPYPHTRSYRGIVRMYLWYSKRRKGWMSAIPDTKMLCRDQFCVATTEACQRNVPTCRRHVGDIASQEIWGHRSPTHGERGQSWWRIQWRRLILLLLCVYCVCVYVAYSNVLLANQLVETWSGTRQNGRLLLNHNIKNTTKPPQCLNMCHIFLLWGCGTYINIWADMLFWLPVECAKRVSW